MCWLLPSFVQLLGNSRPPCVWSRDSEGEWGWHLVCCPWAPVYIASMRSCMIEAKRSCILDQSDDITVLAISVIPILFAFTALTARPGLIAVACHTVGTTAVALAHPDSTQGLAVHVHMPRQDATVCKRLRPSLHTLPSVISQLGPFTKEVADRCMHGTTLVSIQCSHVLKPA